jgi:glycosyltransferase involved in cell wall biosynthesis
MGMPVVTNAIGAEGIPGENGVHWYVGNSDKEIAEYVDLLIDNPEISAHMSVQAQKLVDDNFSWNAATKAFAKAGL